MREQSAWQAIPSGGRHAAFDISVGNDRCSGSYLVAQMRWALDQFDTFEVSFADTLAVHTYMAVGHPVRGLLGESAAREVALMEGSAWMDRNYGYIRDELPGGTRVTSWDRWMGLQPVQRNLAALRRACDNDVRLRGAIWSWIAIYLDRRKVNRSQLAPSACSHLEQYVLEELAVYQHQVESTNAINVYPGLDLATYDPLLRAPGLPAPLLHRHFVTLRMG